MKKITYIMTLSFLVLLLVSCSPKLSSIEIQGADNKVVNVGSTFNVYEGVNVVSNDSNSYNDYLNATSYACGFDEEGNLYTGQAKTCDITYIAVVEGKYVKESIQITIKD